MVPENYLVGGSYYSLDGDLNGHLSPKFERLETQSRVNYNQGCENGEDSQYPGGVGVEHPCLLFYYGRLESLLDQQVESDVQKATDVQLKQIFRQPSTEYFLGFEDYALPDTCCLWYDADAEKIVVSVAVVDCSYQLVYLENDDYSLTKDYDSMLDCAFADGDDGGLVTADVDYNVNAADVVGCSVADADDELATRPGGWKLRLRYPR